MRHNAVVIEIESRRTFVARGRAWEYGRRSMGRTDRPTGWKAPFRELGRTGAVQHLPRCVAPVEDVLSSQRRLHAYRDMASSSVAEQDVHARA